MKNLMLLRNYGLLHSFYVDFRGRILYAEFLFKEDVSVSRPASISQS